MTKYYISKYYLNAHLEKQNSENMSPNIIHIALYIEAKSDSQMFDTVEKRIQDYINPYQNTNLNELEKFRELDISMEKLGETLYEELKQMLKEQEIDLYQLEIYKTPLCKYKVSDRLLLPFQYPLDVVKRIENIQNWSQRLYVGKRSVK